VYNYIAKKRALVSTGLLGRALSKAVFVEDMSAFV
jgi:hypothetical protein